MTLGAKCCKSGLDLAFSFPCRALEPRGTHRQEPVRAPQDALAEGSPQRGCGVMPKGSSPELIKTLTLLIYPGCSQR